jgi:hypothetical protein
VRPLPRVAPSGSRRCGTGCGVILRKGIFIMAPAFESILTPMPHHLDALTKALAPQMKDSSLKEIINEIHRLENLCGYLWDRTNFSKRRIQEIRCSMDALELRISQIFGAKRHWQLSRKQFSWRAFIGAMENRCLILSHDLPPFCDHPIFYADLDGKPAAIAAHEYHFNDAKRRECEQFAAATGIVFELPDFQSWHSPGTTLVLWRVKQDGE